MAAIGQIRKHYGILVVIIGLALLAFVLGDLFKSTNRRQQNDVAVVNGEKITYQDFANLAEQNIENQKRNTGSISNDDAFNVRNQTLEQMIREIIMNEEFSALGLTVTSAELVDQFLGDEPNQYVAQSFQDANGKFDREAVRNFINNFDQYSPEMQASWLDFENAIMQDRLNTKYESLLKHGFYMPKKLADRYNENKNAKKSAEVYAVRYTTIPDSTVVVTEQDNRKYYEQYKNKYQADETRAIDYIVFDVKPSKADYEAAKNYVESVKEGLAQTSNVANFVAYNSDMPYDSSWKLTNALPVELEDVVANNEVGFVYGPYESNGAYNVARIMDKANRSDSLMASHVLIAYQGALRSSATRTKEQANALADSLYKTIKKSGKIEGIVSFSDDPSAKTNNGDLGWFLDGAMVPTFNEFVQNNKVGTVGVVESPFGYHIVKVTNRNEAKPMARVAVITHEITASSETDQMVFADVNKFVTENKTAEQFNAAIEAQGLNKRTFPSLKKYTNRITGINNPREIVRWAFKDDVKVGDMSNVFELENMYVVAVLTKITPEGVISYDDMIERYAYQIKKVKKGEMLAEKAKSYGTDYQKMIDELKGEKTTIDNISFDGRSFGNFGVEDKVIGSTLGMKEGVYSAPIEGGNALVVVKVTKNAPAGPTDYASILREKKSNFNNQILNGSAYSALRDNAEIENNGILFF